MSARGWPKFGFWRVAGREKRTDHLVEKCWRVAHETGTISINDLALHAACDAKTANFATILTLDSEGAAECHVLA